MKYSPADLTQMHSKMLGTQLHLEDIGLAQGFLQVARALEPGMVWRATPVSESSRVHWLTELARLEGHIKHAFMIPLTGRNNSIRKRVDTQVNTVNLKPLLKIAHDHWITPSDGPIRLLPGVKDQKLRAIAERDLAEMRDMRRLGFSKPAVILAGSVIEAVLLDILLQDPQKAEDAAKQMNAGGHRARGGRKWKEDQDFDWWSLEQIIAVCGPHGLKSLKERIKKVADVARGSRNFVHPGAEKKEDLLTQADAALSESLVDLVLQDLGL